MRRERKRPPTHPGAILKAHHLDPLGLSVTAAAEHLGVSRKTLSKILNGRGAITPEMALRLGRAFETTPQLWLNLQQSYDLWHAQQDKSWKQVKTYLGRTVRRHAASQAKGHAAVAGKR